MPLAKHLKEFKGFQCVLVLRAQVRSHEDEAVVSVFLAIFDGFKSILDARAEVQKDLVIPVVVTDKIDYFVLNLHVSTHKHLDDSKQQHAPRKNRQ